MGLIPLMPNQQSSFSGTRTALMCHLCMALSVPAVSYAQEKKPMTEKVKENVKDSVITTKIKADMINEDLLKDSDVEVHTNNHVVTLSGTVLSPAGRARAVAIARGTDGVQRVVDKITIGPKK